MKGFAFSFAVDEGSVNFSVRNSHIENSFSSFEYIFWQNPCRCRCRCHLMKFNYGQNDLYSFPCNETNSRRLYSCQSQWWGWDFWILNGDWICVSSVIRIFDFIYEFACFFLFLLISDFWLSWKFRFKNRRLQQFNRTFYQQLLWNFSFRKLNLNTDKPIPQSFPLSLSHIHIYSLVPWQTVTTLFHKNGNFKLM